jgi:hypothetical protein
MKNGIIETAEDMQKIKQIEKLQKKLDIATKALKEIEKNAIRKDIKTITVVCINDWLYAHKALKEIDLVGKLVKE